VSKSLSLQGFPLHDGKTPIEFIYYPYRMFYEDVQKKDNFPSGTKKDPMLLLITLNRYFALRQSTIVVTK
jgi:hypothetical protein